MLLLTFTAVATPTMPPRRLQTRVLPVLGGPLHDMPRRRKAEGEAQPGRHAHAGATSQADAKRWFRVLEQIESGSMPPEGDEPLLPAAERQAVAGLGARRTDRLVAERAAAKKGGASCAA